MGIVFEELFAQVCKQFNISLPATFPNGTLVAGPGLGSGNGNASTSTPTPTPTPVQSAAQRVGAAKLLGLLGGYLRVWTGEGAWLRGLGVWIWGW